jgi:23S rRNA pseudouridine2605 synthase
MPCFDETDPSLPDGSVRLQKFLARSGVASRRASEALIREGRVCVNGEVVDTMGSKVRPDIDLVAVDGTPVVQPTKEHYLMLNKPGGYLTTMDDPQHRPTVAALVPVDDVPGLFPVGRLDCDTTGILLFMTDGELAQALLHPRFHVEKCYELEIDGRIDDSELEILRTGIVLDDGPCKPAEVVIRSCGPTSLVTCTISEGRKRQVKRMFSAIGHPVLRLHRASFGPLTLGDLELGIWRELTDNEVLVLKAAVANARETGEGSGDHGACRHHRRSS